MNDGLGTKLINRYVKNLELNKLLDSLLPGFGWDKTPIFNYIAVVDGFEFKGRVYYKAWDTGYINNNLYRAIEIWNNQGTDYIGEKENVEIEFKFIEKNKVFLKKSKDQEIESFKINYDFRTGRWEGSDYFNDSDGYGHFNGSYFEMWFYIYQSDFDHDGIPYWTEVNNLNTNPRIDDSKLDPDEDGIPTSWEWKCGYNPNKWDNHTYLDPDEDGLQNNEEFFMEKWLANPFYPEIYIEVDNMDKTPFKPFKIEMKQGKILKFIERATLIRTRLTGWDHPFYVETQQMLMDRFNEHGITLHIDDGCMGGGGDILPFFDVDYESDDAIYGEDVVWSDGGVIAEFYNNNFSDERKGIFRYLLVMNAGGENFNQDFRGYYDTIIVPFNWQLYKGSLNCLWRSPRMKRIGLAISTLHELGHTMGFGLLYHGGVDNTTPEAEIIWDTYESVMNYDKYPDRLFDYSDGTHGEKDKDDWSNLDVAYFQKTSQELEGLGFDKTEPPFNR